MKSKYDKHETDYIQIYQERGYTTNFYFENEQLKNSETKTVYSPDKIFIVAEHRYEGMTNPEDMSILYVIKTAEGEKGTFLMGYGPTADLELAEFFNAVPKENISDEADINKEEK